MNETRLYLPFRTRVLVQVFTGASYQQKATIRPQSGPICEIQGAGADNKEIGRFGFDTGQPKGTEKSFLVTVGIQYQPAPVAPWYDSQMMPSRPCSAATFTAQFVASEDAGDRDWNDCLVMFTWNSPYASDAESEEEAEGGG